MMNNKQNFDESKKALRIGGVVFNAADYLYETCETGKEFMCKCKSDDDCRECSEVELPEVGCINSLGCACREANGYPLTDCSYWQGN